MRAVAHLTPHAWAVDGFAVLVGHHGTLASILPQLEEIGITDVTVLPPEGQASTG